MARIEWGKQLSIGIDSVDNQHKTLINYINDLDDAINKDISAQAKKELISIVINKLVNYTKVHFVYEEAVVFKFSSYPEAENHREIHEKVFKGVELFKNRIQTEDIDVLGSDLMIFLTQWITNHILKEDMKYADYIKENGIKIN